MLDGQTRGGAATGHRVEFDLEYLPYAAPPEEAKGEEAKSASPSPICELLASYGPIEPEYAAIRRGAALFDATFRGTIVVAGADRREFLQRMLTQDLAGLAPGKLARAFWLNRKGRIDADLTVAHLPARGGESGGERILIDVDRTRAAYVVATLDRFVLSEDVQLADRSAEMHRLELHGPAAARILALAGATAIPADNETTSTEIGGKPVTLLRTDLLGERGWSIVAAREDVGEVWDALLAARDPHDERRRARPIGWHAYNIARVEAGTPLFQIDFGTANVPHETGVLRDRVSFKKGCYLGQEIVARMESLGKPKQMLVGLRPSKDLLPVAGAQVFAMTGPQVAEAVGDDLSGAIGEQVGTVTSSTLAPMLSAVPIAFAMIRTAHASTGTTLLVNAEGAQCTATVTPLRSWPPVDDGSAAAAPGHGKEPR